MKQHRSDQHDRKLSSISLWLIHHETREKRRQLASDSKTIYCVFCSASKI